MLDRLRSLLSGKAQPSGAKPRLRLQASEWPSAIYAIGDVHGCLYELLQLEQLIVEDAKSLPAKGERWLVMLGDYVDRGPATAQVLDHLLDAAPAGFRRICLLGNHEQMLLDFLADAGAGRDWLDFGGVETAASYGLTIRPGGFRRKRTAASALSNLMPGEHVEFLRELPISLSVPGFHFVHAGMRPGIAMPDQTDEDLIWIREPFLEEIRETDAIVVHGHTPGIAVEVRPWRIGIDTAAFASGRLSAVRLRSNEAPVYFATGS